MNPERTYQEVADILKITVQEVKDAEASALKKLRHPRVGALIKKYLS